MVVQIDDEILMDCLLNVQQVSDSLMVRDDKLNSLMLDNVCAVLEHIMREQYATKKSPLSHA